MSSEGINKMCDALYQMGGGAQRANCSWEQARGGSQQLPMCLGTCEERRRSKGKEGPNREASGSDSLQSPWSCS